MNVEHEEPSWWSSRGYVMELISNHPQLIVANNSGTASLVIDRSTGNGGWIVKWMLTHATATYDAGQRVLSDEALRRAFRIVEAQPQDEYAPTAAVFGASDIIPMWFIRRDNFLCFPGPMSTEDSSPLWISIYLTDEIRYQVHQFMQIHGA